MDTSTIDYVFYGEDLQHRVKEIRIMDDIQSNVSDHYPLLLIVELEVNRVPETNLTMPQSSRIKWDKVDQEAYNATVAESLSTLKTDISSLGVLDSEIRRLNENLIGSAEDHAPKKLKRHRKAKLKVCAPEIKQAIKEKKKAFCRWKEGNRPGDEGDVLVINKKLTTKYLRKLCRMEAACVREQLRQEILEARSIDTKLCHKLVNRQRGNKRTCVNKLNANGQVYKTDSEMLNGWRAHFKTLATPDENGEFDKKYSQMVSEELPVIAEICKDSPVPVISKEQVQKAIKTLNTGKAPDMYGVTAEHFLNGGEAAVQATTNIVNSMFQFGKVTEALKVGALTPVYKKKGSCTDAKNYRGITVLPVITKILEIVLRDQIQPYVDQHQNILQRGFTKHSSPMNCSLIMEEVVRDRKDRGQPVFAAFLDVKSAFDVVPHDSLLRRLYHAGVEGRTWSLIHSLHSQAQSVVKWQGNYS